MAPQWPQVNNGPEHINEHATYLREACNQLQAVDRGKQNQVPWHIVQSYIASTITLVGKVLRQPAMSEILHHIQDAAKHTQNIQRDISVIKNSVGWSTAPPHAANFSRDKGAASTWAQVAAHAKGSPPIPPPPTSQRTQDTKAQSTVTSYKDRAVTVKLKDPGVAQRLRTLPAAKIRNQIETSIRDNAATKSVTVVAAHQLKSGDIQVFTSSTTEATKLKENNGWISGLGEHAELIVPTYGVIVHGISTNSINIKDQKATIQQILADNYTVIPKAEISFIGWLTRESPLKRASSIQCFRCYNYGHIGAQCDAAQRCGYCAKLYKTKNCKHKEVESFTPIYAVYKARKKEIDRVKEPLGQAPTTLEAPISRARETTLEPPTPLETIDIYAPGDLLAVEEWTILAI
ncbi:hypothetical protein AOQ84DRAFT_406188 [Glonium stellatum]|uniref:CCHC-type domain-containing protein n=1 Tax=Glonium stellatum TaxID=574774 RepID=A0A8E2FDT3_9PEZI|nr:hypothetical protein AOQ84DRAFT_406188 [Glonium stellatum]